MLKPQIEGRRREDWFVIVDHSKAFVTGKTRWHRKDEKIFVGESGRDEEGGKEACEIENLVWCFRNIGLGDGDEGGCSLWNWWGERLDPFYKGEELKVSRGIIKGKFIN